MRDHLRSLVRDVDPLRGRNILREYLQARILEGLQRAGAFVTLAFQGGPRCAFFTGCRATPKTSTSRSRATASATISGHG